MTTLDEEIRRADGAARLMADPLLAAAFDGIEAGIVDAMRRSSVGDVATHHELVLTLQLHGRLKAVFAEHIETGKLARIQKETLAQKAKRFVRRPR